MRIGEKVKTYESLSSIGNMNYMYSFMCVRYKVFHEEFDSNSN